MREKIHVFPPPTAPAPLWLSLAGTSWCDGSYRILRRRADIAVFEYVVSGRGVVRVDRREYAPAAGDVYILPPGHLHDYRSDADDPWVKRWFNVEGPLASTLLAAYGMETTVHWPECPAEALFRRGLSRCTRRPEEAHALIGPWIMELLALLARQRDLRHSRSPSETGRAMRDFLEARVFGPMPTLAEVARAARRSPSQAIRIFRRDFSTSPYDYLLRRKIDTARLLLHRSTQSVKAIAGGLGFHDVYYFSRLFKQKTGRAPTAARHGDLP